MTLTSGFDPVENALNARAGKRRKNAAASISEAGGGLSDMWAGWHRADPADPAVPASRSVSPPQITPQNLAEQQKVRQELEHREAARRHLIPFCEYMWPGFVASPHRQLIAAALELAERRIITRLMIFCPPQYGKSELFTRSFIPWYMGRHPDHELILASYGDKLAYDLSADARAKVMDPNYRAIFGNLSATTQKPVEIARTSKSAQGWRLQGYKGRLKAAGVGSGITGHPAQALLIDDPVKNWKDADSPTYQEDSITWYNSSAYTRVDPKGIIAVAQTRWNENDLGGYLLEKQRYVLSGEEEGDLWYVLRLPARAETPAEIAEWCRRHHITPDRHLVAGSMRDLGSEIADIMRRASKRRQRAVAEVAV